jgi:hypothetical protein
MSVKTKVEAAVVSIHGNTNDGTARVNLRWEGKHQIADFALNKLGAVLNSEGEAEHNGWAIAELPVKATVGKTNPSAQIGKMTIGPSSLEQIQWHRHPKSWR